MKLAPEGMGLLWEEVYDDRPKLELARVSTIPIPETGWLPPTDWPLIRDASWIGLDVETFDPDLDTAGPGWARGVGHVVGVSLAWSGGKRYFPIAHTCQSNYNMNADNVWEYLKWVLGGTSVIIGANITYDIGWLRQHGIKFAKNRKIYDVQFAEALISETSKVALDDLGWKYLKRGKFASQLKKWCQQSYKAPETKWRKNIYRCPPSLVGPYAEDDAEMPYEILKHQWKILEQRGLLKLFFMECNLINLFVEMRFAGITVDIPYTEQLIDKFTTMQLEQLAIAERMSGCEININAAASLAKSFDALCIPYPRTSKGAPSFTGAFLDSMTDPFGKVLKEVRKFEKLIGTFLKSYIIENHVNGKVFTSFMQMSTEDGGTRTGRLASKLPNLQNIPIRTKEGKMIRDCFIMDYGHKELADYDYSQIEYRMLAHFATGVGSDEVRQAFNDNPMIDYHNFVGNMIIEITQITLARGHIKNINFGSIYGVGVDHMAEMLNVELSKARELLTHYHKALPYVKDTMRTVAAETNRTGIVETILGRQSHFDEWESADYNERSMPMSYESALAQYGNNIQRSGLYKALNYKFQGSAADMMKLGMERCWMDGIFDSVGVPRLTVHDELVFSDDGHANDSDWKEMQHMFETCMPGLKVPIVFEGGRGQTWGTAH